MAATDFFMKIDGIKGESSDDKHKDEIDVLSWSFGVSQTGTAAHGGGAGAGKASFQDVHFTMKANKASPEMLLACASGKHIKEAILTARKAGGDQQEYFKVTFEDVMVSSYQAGGSGGSDLVPTDQVSLNFSKMKMEYKPQKKDGSLDSAVTTGWDLKANKKV